MKYYNLIQDSYNDKNINIFAILIYSFILREATVSTCPVVGNISISKFSSFAHKIKSISVNNSVSSLYKRIQR